MDYKWESGEKNLFDYHFKVGDYVSIKSRNGNSKLAKVEQVLNARLWVKLVNFGESYSRSRSYGWGYRMSESDTFLVTAQDFIKKGYPLYKQKKEEIKENNRLYHQDCINHNSKYGKPQKSRKPSKSKLIQKKSYESEDAPSDYQSIYNYFSPNTGGGKAFGRYIPPNNNDEWSYSKKKDDESEEEEEDEQYEIKILTEEEYQQIVEKMSYNKFLNQFIKQEKVDRELNIEKLNNNNNKNSKIKTFEINEKRVRRFAMKYIKPKDLEQRLNQNNNNNNNYNNNNNNNNSQQQQQNQVEQQNQFDNNNYDFEINNNNYDENKDNYYNNQEEVYYNDQVYQEEVYYIEPEEVVAFDDYNIESFDKVGGSDDGKAERKIIYQKNELFKKLEKELKVSTNHYYNEDYERLINTFNSGFILQDEFHQRRMYLLRDHFNIDLSKYQI
ncbi:hypothetical protein ACTFIU_008013 [Dictyostelium citrinum]